MFPFIRFNKNKLLENRISELEKQLTEYRNVLTDEDSWLHAITAGTVTNAGTYVNTNSAFGIPAVYSCVRILAWTIAGLPLHVYKRLKPRGKEKAYDHPVYDILHNNPNPEQSSFEFRSLMVTSQLLWGAGIAEIERVNGQPRYLWPIPTQYVTPKRTPHNNLLIYEVNAPSDYKPNPEGGLKPITRYLWPEDVLVFPALTSTKDCWKSPITVHRETLGYSMALQEFGSKTFGQGVNPAGIVSVDSPLSEEAEKNLIKQLEGYSGLSKITKLMYLNAGVSFEKVGLPPQDAQLVEATKMTIAEIARIFTMPLFLLNETDGSSNWGTGIEEQNNAFISYTLNPYLIQEEQEYGRKLFSTGMKREEYFPEFCVEGLLRGKILDRYQAYVLGRQGTFLSPDDIREKENMNPLPSGAGERYDTPMNMINVDVADKVAQQKTNPQPKDGSGTGGINNNKGATK